MATRGKKISEQTLAASLDGNEIIPFAKNGADGAVKASKIKEYVQPDLTAKQDKLVNSDDVTIGIDNKLTVTDLAKKKVFIDQCKAMGVVYNDATGYFELNGLVDITTEQMRHIFNNYGCMRTVGRLPDSLARTNFGEHTYPSYSPSEKYSANLYCKFIDFKNIEVIVLDPTSDMWVINVARAFSGCSKLREIRGAIRFNDYLNMYQGTTDSAAFEGCIKLQEVRISHRCNRLANIDLKWSPLLSLDSISYLIENKGNNAQLTVTVHTDVYAKLTGDTTNAAASALTADELAQWQALVTTANSKNISFATTSN